jgi:hypothetical protein
MTTGHRWYVVAPDSRRWFVVDRTTGHREGPFPPAQATAIVRDRNQGKERAA